MIKLLDSHFISKSTPKPRKLTEEEEREKRRETFEACLIGIDWQHPDWDEGNRVHNWRNYAPFELIEMWETFTDEQKKAIAFALDECASNEHWE